MTFPETAQEWVNYYADYEIPWTGPDYIYPDGQAVSTTANLKPSDIRTIRNQANSIAKLEERNRCCRIVAEMAASGELSPELLIAEIGGVNPDPAIITRREQAARFAENWINELGWAGMPECCIKFGNGTAEAIASKIRSEL